jgi:hypothetical protein
VEEQRYLTDAFGEEAARLRGTPGDSKQPFFLYLAFNAVHTPLQAIEKYNSRFPGITDPKRRIYAAMLSAMDDAIGLVLTELEETGKSLRRSSSSPTTTVARPRAMPSTAHSTPLCAVRNARPSKAASACPC